MYSAHLAPIVPSTPLVAPRSWHWALDGHPPTNNQILRMDWRKRHRTLKPWKEQTILLVRSERPRQPLAHASVVLTLAYLRKPFRDLDGVASTKPAGRALQVADATAGEQERGRSYHARREGTAGPCTRSRRRRTPPSQLPRPSRGTARTAYQGTCPAEVRHSHFRGTNARRQGS